MLRNCPRVCKSCTHCVQAAAGGRQVTTTAADLRRLLSLPEEDETAVGAVGESGSALAAQIQKARAGEHIARLISIPRMLLQCPKR